MTTLRDCYTPMEISEEEEELRADPYYKKPVGWERTAQDYRQNNWSQATAPFHKAFLASTRQESSQAYTNAFRPRSGPYASLHIDIPKEKEDEKIVVSKSATQQLSPNSKAKVLWESF